MNMCKMLKSETNSFLHKSIPIYGTDNSIHPAIH